MLVYAVIGQFEDPKDPPRSKPFYIKQNELPSPDRALAFLEADPNPFLGPSSPTRTASSPGRKVNESDRGSCLDLTMQRQSRHGD